MEIKPYKDSRDKKTQVRSMFNDIAPKYDFLNHFLSLGIDHQWRKKTVKAIKSGSPKKILDVATGTADLAIEIKRQIPGALVTGLDLSPEMIRVGKKKLDRKGLQEIELLVGDSESLPFNDNTFDAITVAFGVRNFGDLNAGLAEMLRVLRPGGVLAILEFSRPQQTPFKQIYKGYFKFILPNLSKLWTKDPDAYTYLYDSASRFPEREDLQNILKDIGYNNLYYRQLTLGICCIYVAEKPS